MLQEGKRGVTVANTFLSTGLRRAERNRVPVSRVLLSSSCQADSRPSLSERSPRSGTRHVGDKQTGSESTSVRTLLPSCQDPATDARSNFPSSTRGTRRTALPRPSSRSPARLQPRVHRRTLRRRFRQPPFSREPRRKRRQRATRRRSSRRWDGHRGVRRLGSKVDDGYRAGG